MICEIIGSTFGGSPHFFTHYKGTHFFAYMQTFRLLFFAYKRNFFIDYNRPALGTLTFFKIFFFFIDMNIRRFASPIGSFSLFNRLICFTMAIIKNGLSMMMRGKVGAFSYYVSETRQIVRQAENNSNFGDTATRAPKQQNRRVKWANLVNFYSGNKGWMKKAFENLKPGVSVFNAFMSANISGATVALTKAQAKTKMCVLQPFVVCQGSLPSITPLTYNGDGPSAVRTLLGNITAETTVAQYSQAIISENAGFQNGDAIVAVSFAATEVLPSASAQQLKPATYTYNEFVIDSTDSSKMQEKYPLWGIAEQQVICSAVMFDPGYVYIHTRTSGGKLIVSTERIVLTSGAEGVIEDWSSQSQVDKATDSYNVETPVLLAPGGTTTGSSSTDNNPGTDGGGGGDDDDILGD